MLEIHPPGPGMGFGRQKELDQEFLAEKGVEVLGGKKLKPPTFRPIIM